uniref:uncharacterized protein LOC122595633 isoform X2 n=1 Tax=Erigeron canadensis TaxID=72917 RepID=UPI001CB934AF|nr:uncharacterized protein LOC122595633 isoform X2 [Erigeron canadensis]
MIEPQQATTPLAPYVIRNFILPLLVYTDKSLINLTHKFKLFKLIRYTLVKTFLFFLKIIQSFFLFYSNFNPNPNYDNDFYLGSFLDSDSETNGTYLKVPFIKGTQEHKKIGEHNVTGDTCIARALAQLLAIVNEIPVSSRKYEVVRSYAEKLIDANLKENHEALRKVNAAVLSHAFSHALRQLEMAAEVAAVVENDDSTMIKSKSKGGGGRFGLTRVIKTVGYYGDVAWTRLRKKKTARFEGSAEKLSAELLWLAEKLAACGSGDEAVREWASASKLASVALSAQLRLQGSLVKLSVVYYMEGFVHQNVNNFTRIVIVCIELQSFALYVINFQILCIVCIWPIKNLQVSAYMVHAYTQIHAMHKI